LVHDGQVVVDIWGGYADAAKTQPWQQDTIINVWSTTKTMMYLVMLMLADRGEVDLDDPVWKYWPEFKQNGKDSVLVKHLMWHGAGLAGVEETTVAEDWFDHDLIVSRLVRQAPWWTPGTATGYHAITQGYLLGELVKRVTSVSLGTFFRTQVAEPLGADFHIGTPASCDDRIALVIPPSGALTSATEVGQRAFANPIGAELSWQVGWRRCESAAANGHGNARSVARIQSVISHGGEIEGVRLLSEQGARRAIEFQIEGRDLVLDMPIRFGMGYGLASASQPLGGPGACFWGGWGGSLCINELDQRFTFSYVMNKMNDGTTGDLRGALVLLPAMGVIAS
jgi:CubicO group peptidase (beta-lactamase class C family)